MMWTDLWTAVALFLVLEGLMPFLSPGAFKRNMAQILGLPDRVLRTIGLACMCVGVLVLYLVR